MSSAMQDRVLGEIGKIAKEAGLDAVNSPQYANTGSLFLMDGFDTRMQIVYAFQTDYCTLTFRAKGIARVPMIEHAPNAIVQPGPGVDERTAHHLQYGDGERITKIFAFLKEGLAA